MIIGIKMLYQKFHAKSFDFVQDPNARIVLKRHT